MPRHSLPPSSSPSDLPLTAASLAQMCHDAALLTARYGSTSAACARLDELEHAHVDLQTQVATLQQKLNMAMVAAAAAQVDQAAIQQDAFLQGTRALNVDAFMAFLQRHCACRGDLTLLFSVLADYQRHVEMPDAPLPPRDVLISVHEIVPMPNAGAGAMAAASAAALLADGELIAPSPVPFARQHRPKREITSLTPKAKARSTTIAMLAMSQSNGHAMDRTNGQTAQGDGMHVDMTNDSDGDGDGDGELPLALEMVDEQDQHQHPDPTPDPDQSRNHDQLGADLPPPPKRARVLPPASDIEVKQNLALPQDKRNVGDLKHSSQFVTLAALDQLIQAAPWDHMFERRARISRMLDAATLDPRVRQWFLRTLRVQSVWRREFWERLHWLPMSEAVCTGSDWDKMRQTRKRRANKAIAAWRKVYAESVELMRAALLPDDVWCDLALWYMPATPVSWLPTTCDLATELSELDRRQPVRCYFVHDLAQHAFYQDAALQRKYPCEFAVPPLSEG